jgi:hypothetical protein
MMIHLILDSTKVIQKYSPGDLPPVPKATNKSTCAVSWTRHGKGPTSNHVHPLAYIPLDVALEHLCPPGKRVVSTYPLTFEDLRQGRFFDQEDSLCSEIF